MQRLHAERLVSRGSGLAMVGRPKSQAMQDVALTRLHYSMSSLFPRVWTESTGQRRLEVGECPSSSSASASASAREALVARVRVFVTSRSLRQCDSVTD